MSEKTCDYFLDTPPDRHGTNSIKWDRQCRGYGCSDLTPLAIADMDFPVAPEIRAALERRAAHPVYGYACMGPGYRLVPAAARLGGPAPVGGALLRGGDRPGLFHRRPDPAGGRGDSLYPGI